MGIEADAQKDLALNPEDADNVVGGTRKKVQKKAAAHKAVGHSLPPIIVTGSVTPVTETTDPSANPSGDGDSTDDC